MRTAIIARAVEAPSLGGLMAANRAAKQVRTKPGFNNWRVHDLSRIVH
jgi:hypothetical protein